MKLTSDKGITTGICLVVALLLLNGGIVYFNTRQLNDDAAQVSQAQDVLEAMLTIGLTMQDAESGQRGYLLTGKPEYLAPYQSAVANIAPQLDRLSTLTRDNPEHQARLSAIKKLVEAKLDELAHTIELYRDQGSAAALEVVERDGGKKIMDSLRAQIAAMMVAERQIQNARSRATDRSYRTAVISEFVTTFLGLAMVIAFVFLLQRHLQNRDRAAKEAFEQREWLQTTLSSIGDGVIATDLEGRVTFLNGVAEYLTGWSAKEAPGKSLVKVFQIVNEDTREPVENPALRACKEGKIVGLANHTVLIAKDGKEWPIDDSAAPIRNQQGELIGAVLVFREISERKRQEKEISEREAQFRVLADTIPQLAWMARPDGHIIWYNQRWFEYTGTTLEQMEGWGWQAVHDPAELPRVLEKFRQALEKGDRWEDTFPLRRHDGQFRWHLSRMMAVRDEAGKIIRWFGTNTDITEQRDAELRAAEIARLAALRADVASNFSSQEGVSQILQKFTAALVEHLDVVLARIWTLSESQEFLELQGNSGIDIELEGQNHRIAVGDYKIGRIASTGQPYLTNNLQEDSNVADAEWARREGMLAFAGYPLLIEGRVLGVLAVFARHPLSDEILDDLAPLANSIAQFLERRRVQVELQSSQQFLRSSLDALSSHIAVLDETGKILTVNAAWQEFARQNQMPSRYYGVGDNYLQASSVDDSICDFDTPDVCQKIRAVIDGKVSGFTLEYPCHSPTEERWYQMRVTRFTYVGAIRVVVAHEDITQRILYEKAIRARSEQLQGLAEIATRLNVAHDIPSILGVVVQGAREIIGAYQGFASQTFDQHASSATSYVSLDDKYAPWRGQIETVVQPELNLQVCQLNLPLRLTEEELKSHPAYQHVSSDESTIAPMRGWLSAPLTGLDGRNIGALHLSDKYAGDFTPYDEAILVQLARMTSGALENARLYAELHESARRKDEFLAMLGHELRNPLAGIVTGVQVLRMQNASVEAREMQAVIDRQAAHMSHIVDDLLDVSRIARGKLALRKDRLNLAELIQNAVEDYRNGHVIEDCELLFTAPKQDVWVLGDRTRLAQVITNLVHNGCKFCDGPNEVKITADPWEQVARIVVTDRGIGMSQDTLNRIFEPFNQADTSLDRSRGGLGLGLALVKGIVELHGGTVRAASEGLGKGTQFTVELPVCEAPASTVAAEPTPAARTFRRVLLIDDRRDAIFPVQKMLQLEGHEVTTASDGPTGLEKAREFSPDVVLCDIGLAGTMNGYDVARAMRAMPETANVYLVAVTGYGQEEDRRIARAAGFDYHLTKPVSREQLQEVMGRMPKF